MEKKTKKILITFFIIFVIIRIVTTCGSSQTGESGRKTVTIHWQDDNKYVYGTETQEWTNAPFYKLPNGAYEVEMLSTSKAEIGGIVECDINDGHEILYAPIMYPGDKINITVYDYTLISTSVGGNFRFKPIPDYIDVPVLFESNFESVVPVLEKYSTNISKEETDEGYLFNGDSPEAPKCTYEIRTDKDKAIAAIDFTFGQNGSEELAFLKDFTAALKYDMADADKAAAFIDEALPKGGGQTQIGNAVFIIETNDGATLFKVRVRGTEAF